MVLPQNFQIKRMTLFLVFAITLLIAVLVSGLAQRSILSSAILFLVAGFLLGDGVFGTAPRLSESLLERLAEVALYSILFTDGIRSSGLRSVLQSWRLPARALAFGMPLTVAGIAVLARFLLSVSWAEAFLMGAVLSPTDPVFVSAIFRFKGVPGRVKRLLNVESGLNDGLALPLVLLSIAGVTNGGDDMPLIVEELLAGIAIGIFIPWLGIRLEASRFFKAAGLYEPLNAFAIGLLVMAICYVTGANLFFGAYAAGLSVATFSASVAESFRHFGELVAELLKLLALVVFGGMVAVNFFALLPGREYLFILIATFAVRPVVMAISLSGSALQWRERLVAGWFGPKGFASVVYGLLILQAGLSRLAHLVGLAVAASIVIFSSTDILVGRWFQGQQPGRQESLSELKK